MGVKATYRHCDWNRNGIHGPQVLGAIDDEIIEYSEALKRALQTLLGRDEVPVCVMSIDATKVSICWRNVGNPFCQTFELDPAYAAYHEQRGLGEMAFDPDLQHAAVHFNRIRDLVTTYAIAYPELRSKEVDGYVETLLAAKNS